MNHFPLEYFKFYRIGGCVRDELLGVRTKDIDYTVVWDGGGPGFLPEDEYADGVFFGLLHSLEEAGYEIFEVRPDFFTIRGKFPPDHPDAKIAADFVLARIEGEYSDGRHPDSVRLGTLADDQARRDFTVNSIAKDGDTYIDPHNGIGDLNARLLRCVGSAEDRIREDALRALRALRFRITKGFHWDGDLSEVLYSSWVPPLLADPKLRDRRREELQRMFKYDNKTTFRLLAGMPEAFFDAVFVDGMWLDPSHAKSSNQ